jgi:Uma2 family endonuclease
VSGSSTDGNLADTSERHTGSDAANTTVVLALKLRDAPTNADIERLAAENPGYRFERAADGTLIVSPTGSNSGLRNSRLNAAVFQWNKEISQPGFCFDSSTGFTLPDGSLISPDAAWIAGDRWLALTDDEREGYAPIVPDVVVEVASKTDRPAVLRANLERCRSLGARYVTLLDPYRDEQWSDGQPPAGLHLTLDSVR